MLLTLSSDPEALISEMDRNDHNHDSSSDSDVFEPIDAAEVLGITLFFKRNLEKMSIYFK